MGKNRCGNEKQQLRLRKLRAKEAAGSSSGRAACTSSAQAAGKYSSARAAPSNSANAARPSSVQKAADDTDEEGEFSPADEGQAAIFISVQAGKSNPAQAGKSSSTEQKVDSGRQPPALYEAGQSVLQWWASWFAGATEPQLSVRRKTRGAWFRGEVTTAAVWKQAGTYAGQAVGPGWRYLAH